MKHITFKWNAMTPVFGKTLSSEMSKRSYGPCTMVCNSLAQTSIKRLFVLSNGPNQNMYIHLFACMYNVNFRLQGVALECIFNRLVCVFQKEIQMIRSWI